MYTQHFLSILSLLTIITAQRPVQNSKPYYPHISNWGHPGVNGDRIALKRWYDYGCPSEESVLGQDDLVSGHCKSYKHQFESMMWELWPRPKNPDRDDETAWNCTVTVYEGKDCEGKKLVVYSDKEASTPKKVRCMAASDPADTDRVGHSVFVHCNGATGYSLAITKPFCIDPRATPGRGKGLLASFHAINLDKWDLMTKVFWQAMDMECKIEPFLNLAYNTTDYWNAKKHHETDPYWWLKVHEWRHLNGCQMWTSQWTNGLCNTPGTIVDQCGMTTPAWPAWLPWSKDGKGAWQPPAPNSDIKYPPWPNTGYKSCLKAYGEWKKHNTPENREGGPSVVTSWSGPPYYQTVYGTTLDWTSKTAVVSGSTRTRMYPYLQSSVKTVWESMDAKMVATEGRVTGKSTWEVPEGKSATGKMVECTNTATRSVEVKKTRYSTVWLPQLTPSVVVSSALGTLMVTDSTGVKFLSESTWEQTFTVVGGNVTTVGERGPLSVPVTTTTLSTVKTAPAPETLSSR
ncbi:hypothetical protein Slin14017_G080360 [Septoria linicola]|nr:hypothetical protein Slin14017_G080360 [Septoria linicola]